MPETKPIANHKLRYERERRAWSQLELADLVGTSPLNVGRWERGVTSPGPHFRQKLCEVFEKSPQELGLVSEKIAIAPAADVPLSHSSISPAQEDRTIYWNVPYNRNLLFTGREDILAQLHEAFLNGEQPVALAQPQAISGLGGIGKTQTAIEYAYRYRDSYDAVLWARADSADLLTSDFLLIAALLNLPQRNEQDQSLVVKAVLRWFDTHEGWLLILDNADQLELINEFIPSAGKGHVLLTTRANSTGTMAQRIEIEKMDLEEGMLFLLLRMKRLKGSAGLESIPENIRKQAQNIVEIVDGLPLALDQVGAYIEETGCSLSDYLKFYKSRRNRLLRMRGHNATGHPEPVATTWSLSFEKVERANPAAAELLRLCAFLHPDEIPESMLVEGASELGPILQPVAEDELELNEAIGELRKYSLVKRDPELKLLNIHRLVQAVIKDEMDKETQRELAERVVKMVNRAFPEEDFTSPQRYQAYLPQARACIELIEYWHLITLETADLLHQAGHNLAQHAQYADAASLMQRSLRFRVQLRGPDHPDVAKSLNNLAALYDTQGKYAEAEPLIRRALAIREQKLGTIHPDVAKSLQILAKLVRGQGHYEQAEEFLKRALMIDEKVFEPIHLDVAETLDILAMNYWYQGKYEQAEPLLLRALHIREQLLKAEHAAVASSLNDLAVLYDNQGKYDKAETFYIRSLVIRELAGEDHPDLATSISNLAIFYSRQGKYAEAEQLHLRGLAMRRRIFGAEHPDVAVSLNHFGLLYYIQGRYAEAEQVWLQALAIREQVFGAEHPDVAESLHNLASLYRTQGKYMQAEDFFLRAISIREQRLGPLHPYLGQTLTNFARLYREQEKYEQAESLLLRALHIREQALGPEHTDVAFTLHDLGVLYRLQKKYVEAESFLLRALHIREQGLKPGHPDIAKSIADLGLLYQDEDNHEQAESFYQRASIMQERALGPDHADLAETINNLACLYLAQGNYSQAEGLFRRVLTIRERSLGLEHPQVAVTLENYVSLLRKMGRESEILPLEARAQAIRSKQ